MDWKEINDAIRSRIAEATEGKTGDAAAEARLAALKGLDKTFTQPFFDDGFKSADGKRKGELEAAEAAKTAAEAKYTAAETELAELRKKNPDVQAIKTQYEQEISTLKAKHTEELDKVRTTAVATKVDAFLTRTQAALERRLTKDRAELAVHRLRERVRPVDGGGIEVLQPGKDIPFHAATEPELIDTIVATEYDTAPKESRLSGVDLGGGAGDGAKVDKGWDRFRERGKTVAVAGVQALPEESRERRLAGL